MANNTYIGLPGPDPNCVWHWNSTLFFEDSIPDSNVYVVFPIIVYKAFDDKGFVRHCVLKRFIYQKDVIASRESCFTVLAS